MFLGDPPARSPLKKWLDPRWPPRVERYLVARRTRTVVCASVRRRGSELKLDYLCTAAASLDHFAAAGVFATAAPVVPVAALLAAAGLPGAALFAAPLLVAALLAAAGFAAASLLATAARSSGARGLDSAARGRSGTGRSGTARNLVAAADIAAAGVFAAAAVTMATLLLALRLAAVGGHIATATTTVPAAEREQLESASVRSQTQNTSGHSRSKHAIHRRTPLETGTRRETETETTRRRNRRPRDARGIGGRPSFGRSATVSTPRCCF
jgi:hypothetical protein